MATGGAGLSDRVLERGHRGLGVYEVGLACIIPSVVRCETESGESVALPKWMKFARVKVDRTSSRGTIDSAFPWADRIVGLYADLLSGQTSSPHFHEGALPASKDEIKEALLIVAVARFANSLISEAEIDVYKAAYGRLVNAISAARASSLDVATNIVERAGGVDNLSPSELRDAVRGIAAAYQPRNVDKDLVEMVRLPAEFDARFAALLSTYRQR